MLFALEYHGTVRRFFPVSLALLGMLLLPILFHSSSSAQINGAPPSVTSPGFGGRAVNGTPPSVTSLGRNGFAPSSGGHLRGQVSNGTHHRHHAVNGSAYYPYVYAQPVPYNMDMNGTAADAGNDDDDPEYQGGPTVFDRRGSGRDSYVPVPYPGPAHARSTGAQDGDPAEGSASQVSSEPPQPATVLVFKDGHQVEVGNYAIVSQTLYDLTPGHPRKIALADLDVSATQKQNDDRGISFQLPLSSQTN